MCGSPKTPSVPATPAPAPVPTPADVSPQQTEGQRAKRAAALQYGALSTIKTTPAGVTGTGADLSKPVATALKTTTGS